MNTATRETSLPAVAGASLVELRGVSKRFVKPIDMQILRGSALGTLVGALPGAGADIAAWMSYAVSKKMSKEPEKFGTGHVEGIVESGAANNSALAGAWIPALVFGIPGDSITAIVIGVLYMPTASRSSGCSGSKCRSVRSTSA